MLTINNTVDGYLKNVQIKGNTVQDPVNLADIKSVGDRLENQELYEIPLLCTGGKNLFNGKFKVGFTIDANTGLETAQSNRNVSDFISVDPNVSVVFSGCSLKTVRAYDSNKNIISGLLGNLTPNGTKYIKFSVDNTVEYSKAQVEENTIPTSYEPMKEHQITILSPVQLEKVGDVADRIVEKDGVWGVEKNINTETNINKNICGVIMSSQLDSNALTNITISNNNVLKNIKGIKVFVKGNMLTRIDSPASTSKFKFNFDNSTGYCWITVPTDVLQSDLSDLIDGDILFMFSKTTTPTFIPLPHAQQVKLRTFANKTNILFLTEIEGTIKADVPKSLGATVNTHTTQIDSLNNELERVKKLEESTVSTVTTDKDFTVVEQTNQGYFEDVELKGRTLVNLDMDNHYWNNSRTIGHDFNISMLKPNCKYFVKVELNDNSSFVNVAFANSSYSAIGHQLSKMDGILTSPSDISQISKVRVIGDGFTSTTRVKLILIESESNIDCKYFEGLASVGDGTDEIVVSSVDGDGNLFSTDIFKYNEFIRPENGKIVLSGLSSGTSVVRSLLKLKANTKYTLKIEAQGNQLGVLRGSIDKNATWHNDLFSMSYDIKEKVFTTPSDGIVNIGFVCDTNKSTEVWDVQLTEGTIAKPYTQHKSDKKRLLFYNPTTEKWEKPTLREWDSVEKHSDGKYYYHVRSGEVVLDGSRDWSIEGSKTDNILFRVWNSKQARNKTPLCDLFIGKVFDGKDEECISIGGSEWLFVSVNKSKLPTQDVAGFKAWLQANNVTVVYQLAKEEVYECTNIDLITYENETNFTIKSGVLSPRTTLKVHSNISNVVSLLQKKVSLLESNYFNMFKLVLNGDMRTLAEVLYPQDFIEEESDENGVI